MADVVETLGGVPLFQGVKPKELKKLAARMQERTFGEGDTITTEGKSGVGFFVIEDGTAEVVRGEEHVADLGPGDFFGEMALLGDTVRNADVVTSSPMTAMVMTDTAFRSLARRMPDVAEEIRTACRVRTKEICS